MRQTPFGGPRNRQPQVGFQNVDKEKRAVLLRLLRFVLRHYKWYICTVLLCIVVASLTSLASTLFTRTLIDDYVVPLTHADHPDFRSLWQALFRLGLVLLGGVVASYVYNRLMIIVSQGIMLRLRRKLFSHMQKLPVSFFDQHTHGELMSVYTNDIDTLRQVISTALAQVFSTVITIVAVFTSMVVLSLPLTLVSVVMAGVMMVVTAWLGKWSRRFFRQQQESLARVNAFIEEMMTGQRVVKVFCHEREAIRQFETINEQLRSEACNANRIASIIMPVNGNLGNLTFVLIAVVGATIALGQFNPFGLTFTVSLGTIVAFLQLNKSFMQPVTQVSQQVNAVLNGTVGAERVFCMVDAEPECDDGMQQLSDPQGDVDFQHVGFSYLPGKPILFDININTSPGQKIAFVGGTGAGKTTIINLINRFYDVGTGRLLYDGTPINEFSKESLRRSMSIVPQDTHLFTGTVTDNIRYGRLDATDEECRAAARLVGADDFIRRLAHGYDTFLTGDGGNLSAGERQLLAIARAAVANPPVLILDEATSSIDTRTEQLVQRGMDTIMQGRTTFIIAHRLSTVRNADQIIVLEHGSIIEHGTHAQLLALKGRYYQLHTGTDDSLLK